MNPRVGIIDYSISNLTSVLHAFHHIGVDAEVTKDPKKLDAFSHLVLPGVGSFPKGMENLHAADLVSPIIDWAMLNKPLLGLCLGMQLLSDSSEEFGETKGLGLIHDNIVKMNTGNNSLRLPHVGWNDVVQCRESKLLKDLPNQPNFYFVHSYCYSSTTADYVTGVCEYGIKQVAMVEKGNIFGVQFHPEKSQSAGLLLLRNFVSINK